MNDDPLMMKVEHTITISLLLLFAGAVSASFCYNRGRRLGRCVEMCRPAQFDAAQEVNGGCLCIGSDKVLRLKKVP